MRLIEAANARLQSAAPASERRVARLLRQCEGPKIPNEGCSPDGSRRAVGWLVPRAPRGVAPCARAGARPNLQVWYLKIRTRRARRSSGSAEGLGVRSRKWSSASNTSSVNGVEGHEVDGFGKRRRSSGLLYGLPAALGGPRRSRTISGLLGENHQHVPGTNNGLNNQSVGSVHV